MRSFSESDEVLLLQLDPIAMSNLAMSNLENAHLFAKGHYPNAKSPASCEAKCFIFVFKVWLRGEDLNL